MDLIPAFLLGLVGSLHCAGMCGPLVMLLPARGWTGRSLYNLGRVSSYVLIGGIFGLAGEMLNFGDVQRWLSLAVGALIIVSVIFSRTTLIGSAGWRLSAFFKRAFKAVLGGDTVAKSFFFGVVNGFLPCGLVYVAAAGALAAGSLDKSVLHMLAFGAGTMPMMLGIGMVGQKAQLALRLRWQKIIPITVLLMGTLLVVRGLSLGIPYLSPEVTDAGTKCSTCVAP